MKSATLLRRGANITLFSVEECPLKASWREPERERVGKREKEGKGEKRREGGEREKEGGEMEGELNGRKGGTERAKETETETETNRERDGCVFYLTLRVFVSAQVYTSVWNPFFCLCGLLRYREV